MRISFLAQKRLDSHEMLWPILPLWCAQDPARRRDQGLVGKRGWMFGVVCRLVIEQEGQDRKTDNNATLFLADNRAKS